MANAWIEHVKTVRKANPSIKSLKKILQMAKKSYKPGEKVVVKKATGTKKAAKKSGAKKSGAKKTAKKSGKKKSGKK
ncbi:MAG: hypothetical protein ACR2M6_02010 [Vampirovibrionia bacterium]